VIVLRELLVVIEDDREIVELLLEAGVLPPPIEREYSEGEVELARVARTLVRELEVNAAGVEVILRMREEMLAMRRQMAEVLELLRKGGRSTE
jgi:hypothetical protein